MVHDIPCKTLGHRNYDSFSIDHPRYDQIKYKFIEFYIM